jgi:restriction endonuclease
VSGHQDRYAEYQNLKHEEQLNVEADKEATEALKSHSHSAKYNQMPTTIAMIYYNGLPITSKEADTLREAYGQIEYAKHVTNKEKWKQATFATIWWKVNKRTLLKLEDNDRTRITKFVNRILPSNAKPPTRQVALI